jgi:acyl-CoA synthetase (AMP-forming)/AMP-acid ligase II
VVEETMNAQPAAGLRVFTPYSLDTLVAGAARLRPQTIAFADRWRACSYAVIATQVAALARLFADCGLQQGERLLFLGGAEISLVAGLIAALRGGFEPVLAPLDLNPEELSAFARAVNAAALIAPTDYGELKPIDACFQVAAAAASIRLVATLGPGEIDGAVDLSPAAVLRFAAAHPDDGLERGKPAPAPPRIVTLDRRNHKPIAHEQATLMAASFDFSARAEIGRGTPILSTLPPTSFAGLVAGPFAALLSGATLHLHGPFAADDFLKSAKQAGHAHLVIPAAIAPDLADAAILEGLASAVLVSRLADRFTPPPPFACPCPLIDLYAIDESTTVAEPRRGAQALQPAPEPHYVGLDEARILTVERIGGQALAFRGAAVTTEATLA